MEAVKLCLHERQQLCMKDLKLAEIYLKKTVYSYYTLSLV